MLTASILLADLGASHEITGDELRLGSSYLAKFESPLLSLSVDATGGRVDMVVKEGERLTDLAGFDIADFHHQAVSLTFDREGGGRIEAVRSRAPGCPIYVTFEAGRLVLTWRFEEAVASLERVRPDVDECRLYVEHGPALTRGQVIEGIYNLWPGERVSVTGAGLRFAADGCDDVFMPTSLATDARVTDEFFGLLHDALSPLLDASASAIVEVSGGLDSSLVAVVAAAQRDDLLSYGLIHGGVVGGQQRARRSELLGVTRLKDSMFPSDAPSPFGGLGHAESRITPMDDNHRMPCALAVDRCRLPATDLLLAGIGGDELCMEHTFFKRDWELPGTMCSSVLTGCAQRFDMFMRRGIWVSNPLSYQPLVDFCRSLPRQLRKDRLLPRLALARSGLSDGFLLPELPEHYGTGMQYEAALFDFGSAFRDCVLADCRILDVGALIEEAAQAHRDGFTFKTILKLFWALKLEGVLRQHCR